jgi:hypothetical protein
MRLAERDIVETLLPLATKRMTAGSLTPNRGSVVVVIEFPSDSVLLGGDLEEARSAGTGWSAVIARLSDGHRRSSVFKVPHHGSANADYEAQWSQLLLPEPISVVTSYAASRLPRLSDLRRIFGRSGGCYVAGNGGEPIPQLSRTERHAMTNDGVTIERARKFGHVRLRKKTQGTEPWLVELSDGAAVIGPTVLRQPSGGGRAKKGRSGRRR